MAKYAKTQQHFVILEQNTRPSRYGGLITEIIMVGVKDRQEYKTYVDPLNINARNWQHITDHPAHGFIIRGLKYKDQEKRILNADSDPIIEWEHESLDVVSQELLAHWQEQDSRNNKFNNLFE